MTDAVQVALIVSVPSTIAAVSTLIISLRTHGQVVEVKGQVVEVKKEMNGMQTKLLQSTAKESYARGVKDEKEGNGP